MESLQMSIEQSKGSKSPNFAVIFLDLNRFKTINDSLGHSAGDQLILKVAERLTTAVRPGDVVARFGGDEFAVILHNVSDQRDIVEFAETAIKRISVPFDLDGRRVFTSVSIGIALFSPSYTKAEDLIRDADMAMYQAKESKVSFVLFDISMRTKAVSRLQIETDLRHAIERNELVCYYQPIIDLGNMGLMGFEALMRWQHPQRGLIPPIDFIPISEETGLIQPMTMWILREACSQLAKWRMQSVGNADLVVSVNLSGKHFEEKNLTEQIHRVIVETGIDPSGLKLELTESAIMDNAEHAIEVLKELRSLGVKLSIDDFGTGYSSLSYLHRFPFDMLKVDRSFVKTMQDGTENGEIVRTVIALAKALNLEVIAEGIESIHQLHQLRILGCEFGQGYLFSRPVPPNEAEKLLNDKYRWQNIIPEGTPISLDLNRQYTHLRLTN